MGETQKDGESARPRTDRLDRSVAQSQLFTSAGVLILTVMASFVSPSAFYDPFFVAGIGLVAVVTVLALQVRWASLPSRWVVALPVLDILGLAGMREGAPILQAGLFLTFPVIWMSRHFGLWGAVVSVSMSTTLIWVTTFVRGDAVEASGIPSLVLLPLALSFIATTTFVTVRRTNGQRNLLRQQATIIEAALDTARRQERLLDGVLNAVTFGVLSFDRAGTITMMNDSLRESLREFGGAEGDYKHAVVYQEDRVTPHAENTRPLARAFAGQEFENMVIWIGEPGSRRAALSVTARRFSAPDGSADGGVVVMRDVTAELDAIKARDDLVASVSHELRTPLTSTLGYLELVLDDDGLDEGTRSMVDVALRNSQRLLTIVNDVLRAASDADTQLPMTITDCDIVAIIAEAVNDLRDVASRRGITIAANLPVTAVTLADPLRIRQVIDNLMTNAIKYNRPDGAIEVLMTVDDRHIAVSVTDTGLGISDDEAAKLFERFYRTESAKQSNALGAGLGLNITKDIMVRHGGDLRLESTQGVGSTFTITLPSMAEGSAAAALTRTTTANGVELAGSTVTTTTTTTTTTTAAG